MESSKITILKKMRILKLCNQALKLIKSHFNLLKDMDSVGELYLHAKHIYF